MYNVELKPELNSAANECCEINQMKEDNLCFHCQEPLKKYANITAVVQKKTVAVCCHGCKAAVEFISEQGLSDFYLERDLQQVHIQQDKPSIDYTIDDWAINFNAGVFNVSIYIPGMYCSSCAWLIKKSLNKLSQEHHFDLDTIIQVSSKQIILEWHGDEDSRDTDFNAILACLKKLGYTPSPIQSKQSENTAKLALENELFLKRLFVAGIGTMQVMTYAIADYLGAEASPSIARFLELVSMLVATLVITYSGQHFFANAWRDLKNQHLGMDVPIAIAIGAAFFLSATQTLIQWESRVLYYDSAVMFVFFLLLGRYIEFKTRHHFIDTGDAILKSLPAKVTVIRPSKSVKNELITNPQSILPGDTIHLLSGEIVPCDGVIIKGNAEFDESLVTGESKPVLRSQSDQLLASLRLVSGSVTLRCTRHWQESSLASLQSLISRGKQSHNDKNDAIEIVSRYFVTAILLMTILVAYYWFMVSPERTFEVVLAMLIASCPCAFALAIPVGTTVASNVLRKHGVLLANGDALHLLAKSKLWCFDKTGTLTAGKPEIVSMTIFSKVKNTNNQSHTKKSQAYYLNILAALEANSSHPLANAFAVIDTPFKSDGIEEIPGNGIIGTINEQKYYAGKASWIKQQLNDKSSSYPISHPNSDNSYIYLADKDGLLACVELSDSPRNSITNLSHFLSQEHIKTILISGDNESCVRRFATSINFDRVFAEQTPEEKVMLLKQYTTKQKPITVIGDGANDAPMLAKADVAVAFASGSELSQAQADFLILNSSLSALIILRKVAKKSRRIMQQNLTWAITYNGLVLPLAASGLLTPWIAAIGMSLSSLGVVLNAIRINHYKSI